MAESSKRTSTSRSGPKRTSIVPIAPKPPSSIDPTAIIANHAQLVGAYPISISNGAVLHPYARVVSAEGPVEIAEGCIVWEKATVGPVAPGGKTVLGKGTVVETGAVIEGAILGEGCVVESFARVGEGARIGEFCKIACHVGIRPNTHIPDYTIMYGPNSCRVDTTIKDSVVIKDIKKAVHEKQVGGLQQLIPSNIAKWQ